MEKEKFFTKGNAHSLTYYFIQKFKKPDVKVAYFSAQFKLGLEACTNFEESLRKLDYHPASWDAIAVVEEFSQFDNSFCKSEDPGLIPHDQ
jgi:hypothetical protein